MKHILHLITFFISALSVMAQTTTCDIVVESGGSIKTHADTKIGIYGNLKNNGSFTDRDGLSEVGFYNPTNALEINGDNTPQFASLLVDVPNDLRVNVKSEVTTGLLFLNGRIITERDNPTASIDLIDTDIVNNEADRRHVDGYTSYTGNEAYIFPVGDDMRLRPISIEPNASTNTTKAAYFFEDPNFPTTFSSGFDRNTKANDVATVNPQEFWDLNGSQPTRVSLSWDPLSNINNLVIQNDLTELRVVGWSKADQQWVNLGNFNVTGNTNLGNITSDTFVPDDYEVITIAGAEIDDNTEDGLEFFNAVASNADNEMNNYFRIKGINQYPNNTLKIYNRWGVEVYSKRGYKEVGNNSVDDVFIGKSNGRVVIKEGDLLPVGTYFYILNYTLDDGGEKSKSGYLYLHR